MASLPLTRWQKLDKLQGFGPDRRAVMVFTPDATPDWMAQGAQALSKLDDPRTQILHIFRSYAQPGDTGYTERDITQNAQNLFNDLMDMDRLTNELHLGISGGIVPVIAFKTPWNADIDSLRSAFDDAVKATKKRAGKDLHQYHDSNWAMTLRNCAHETRNILDLLAPVSNTQQDAQITVTHHHASGLGMRFNEYKLFPNSLHAAFVVSGEFHYATEIHKGKLETDILEYVMLNRGLTIRDQSKPLISTAAYPSKHGCVLNIEAAKKPALTA